MQENLIFSLKIIPKPKFRGFLLYLLDTILFQNPEFWNYSLSEKTNTIQSLIKSSDNSVLALFPNYQYKSFIGDICSDLLYNIKPEKLQNPDKFSLISSLLAYFLDFSEVKVFEKNQKFLIFLYKASKKPITNFLKLLDFLEKELKDQQNLEITRNYIIQIANLPIPLLHFLEFFDKNLKETQIFLHKENSFEILDFDVELHMISSLLNQLFSEENLQIFLEIDKKGLFEAFYIKGNIGLKRNLLKSVFFLKKFERKKIDNKLFNDFSQRKFHENLIKEGVLSENYDIFFECLEIIKKFEGKLNDFYQEIIVKIITISMDNSFQITENYQLFSLILCILEEILQKTLKNEKKTI